MSRLEGHPLLAGLPGFTFFILEINEIVLLASLTSLLFHSDRGLDNNLRFLFIGALLRDAFLEQGFSSQRLSCE